MNYVKEMTDKQIVASFPHVRLDQFFELGEMHINTMVLFNKMCREAERAHGWKHTINSTWRPERTGQHKEGRAIDLVFYKKKPGDVDVVEQFIFASRFNWDGIGFYPYWNTPGLHVDTNPARPRRALWYRDQQGTYFYDGISIIEEIRGTNVEVA